MNVDAAGSVFEWLQGEWAFVREVPGYASVRGEARIAPAGDDAARYEETALVTLARGGKLRAKQCYLHRRLPRPANGIEVRFCETGELFERLEFRARRDGALEARARYVCAEDVYESAFVVRGEQLQVEHVVRGPKKDYRVATTYRRKARNRVRAGTKGHADGPL
ncbi:MAG TPA: DUF6314 family protein [Acidobacteriaceae bacterium]|nr:DUF6314 family protein [Acidobacteriaceae bacterium]